ncbi:MAG: chorismate synthase, partial [Parvibaculaceae bacterium]
MSHNTFGHLFRMTTFGESHGPALGCVVDGCPPGIPLKAEDIQHYLDKRRPGQSRYTTQRREPDAVKILSGVFEDDRTGGQVTTGTPIGLLIENVDQRSKDYSAIRDKFRPGHADYTYFTKYGVRDYRGGGRSSARETASRVAAGAIARKIIPHVTVRGALIQVGPHKIDRTHWDWEEVERNPFFTPDAKAAELFGNYLDEVRKAGSSCGAIIEVVAGGVPAGWGAPVYGKLDQDIAAAMMSINAVKGVEIGAGFA